MKCEACVYNEYCADVGTKKEDCEHYAPICESCRIEVDDDKA